MKVKYVIRMIKNRKWYWRLESYNSKILAVSEKYSKKPTQVCNNLHKNLPGSVIKEEIR